MAGASDSNRALAKKLAEVIGGEPTVSRYRDNDRISFVDVMRCSDAPQHNVCTYATVGLSDHVLCNATTRVEFIAAFGKAFDEGDLITSTAAFCVINSNWAVFPGAIFPGIVSMYREKSAMKHLLLHPPFLWGSLKSQVFGDKTVAWLMLVPISEHEYCLAEEKGTAALEALLVEKQIDVFDLDRPSVI